MFDKNFYPTPAEVIEQMIGPETIKGKTILEPSAGKGDIVKALQEAGAVEVIACELNDDLRQIVSSKCAILAPDFLTVTSEQISHVDYIVMNPPFNNAEKHILHAYEIAPAGCKIIALCNLSTVKNAYTKSRERLSNIIESDGSYEDLGQCFEKSERKTGVEVALVRLQKPGANYNAEFDGFFMEEDPEEQQSNGLMSYNFVRDIVHRYIMAVKVYDEQLAAGAKMEQITAGFYYSDLAFHCTEDGQPKLRNEFKKDLQKAAWKYIFNMMDMKKTMTRGLKEDINNFVEKQTAIPFTMRNIFKMLEIVIGTTGARMDKAILEVFDRVTMHTHENRFNLEGWKTNSQYILNRKFIINRMCETDKWHTGNRISTSYGSNFEFLEDMIKAICYITGENYEKYGSLRDHIRYQHKVYYSNKVEYFDDYRYSDSPTALITKLKEKGIKYEHIISEPGYGELFDWAFFSIRAYKKGTVHFTFKDEQVWALFNQRVAKLKGYPLPEEMKPKSERKKPEPRAQAPKAEKSKQSAGTQSTIPIYC